MTINGGTAVAAALAMLAAAGLGACGASSAASRPPAAVGRHVPSVSAGSFTAGFAAMRSLRPLARRGTGKIGALLPDTTTSPRYARFDAPYLTRAMRAAGLPADDLIVTNAEGSDATEQAQAESDMTQGATVLLLDPIDSGVGATIESQAKARGVMVVDYDRMTLGGSREYYVSFDNVQVGRLMGKGLVNCIASWRVRQPDVLVMRGAPTDNNATLFAQGYDGVLRSYFGSGRYAQAGLPPGTWDPQDAQTTFEQQYTAQRRIDAVLTPNDDTANAVISYLKTLDVPPRTFPTTGQDATLTGLQNILSGYQCGTAYKPIYLEAQAASAIALYLRAGLRPPPSLADGRTYDTQDHRYVPSVLLRPVWVTARNMAATVVRDGFVAAGQLCQGGLAAACRRAGISG